MQGLGYIFQTMKYSRKDYLKIFAILMSTVLLYLSIQELRVALSGSSASAQTMPCSTPSPSPSATPSPTPVVTPLPNNTVFLTEFMACPNTGNEWIELYNASDTPIEATNWQVIDGANNKKSINGTINSGAFSTFQWSGSLLNNTGDSFSVITATGQIIGEGSYESCASGISFVYENGEWVPAIASPTAETEVSENTATTAAAINISTVASLTTSDTIATTSQLTNTSHPTQPVPYKIPTINTSALTEKTLSRQNISSQQHKSSTAPAASVILGGLLQLFSGSYVLYDSYIKQHV